MRILEPTVAVLVGLITAACAAPSEMRGLPQPARMERSDAADCLAEGSQAVVDSLRAACLQALLRFESLFGRPAWPTSVVEVGTLGTAADVAGGRVVLEVGNQGALDERQAASGREVVRMSVSDFVAHELGHTFLVVHMREFGRDSTDGYGTALPDWIDEGIAIWHEFDAGRQERYDIAAELPDSVLDLLGVASRRHPNVDGGPSVRRSHTSEFEFKPKDPQLCVRDPDACDPHGVGASHFRILTWIDTLDVLHVDTVFPGDSRFNWFRAGHYYAVVSTIMPFLHSAGGPSLIAEVIRRARAGSTPAALFTDLPGLPARPEDVNREWIRFVRSRRSPRS
jgi:hypothetical protein